jgi:hypothetical protein
MTKELHLRVDPSAEPSNTLLSWRFVAFGLGRPMSTETGGCLRGKNLFSTDRRFDCIMTVKRVGDGTFTRVLGLVVEEVILAITVRVIETIGARTLKVVSERYTFEEREHNVAPRLRMSS